MSVSSVIRQGLGSTPSDLVRLGLGSGAPPPAAIGPIITLGLKYTPSDVIRLGLGASVSSAATISAAYGTPTSGTTATVGCTTDTASGTLYWAVTTSSTPLSAAAIKAGTGAAAYGSTAVSTTSPSASVTGLTDNTEYWTHVVQTVASVDSNVDTSDSSWWTDNTGSGGGPVPTDLVVQDATHAHTADSPTLTTDSTLVVQDATHGHTADNVVLQIDGETTLAVDDATHGHTADSPTLTTSSTLVVQDATHAHSADNVVLTVPGSGTGATAAEIWAHVLADGRTAEETLLDNARMLRIIMAALSGKTAGLGTNTETYFGEDGAKPRIVATFDGQGNRATVTTDGAL